MLVCKIGQIIDSKGYKRKFIADQVGITQQQLSNWVTGRSYPPIDKAFKLAELLNCTVDDLFEKKES